MIRLISIIDGYYTYRKCMYITLQLILKLCTSIWSVCRNIFKYLQKWSDDFSKNINNILFP